MTIVYRASGQSPLYNSRLQRFFQFYGAAKILFIGCKWKYVPHPKNAPRITPGKINTEPEHGPLQRLFSSTTQWLSNSMLLFQCLLTPVQPPQLRSISPSLFTAGVPQLPSFLRPKRLERFGLAAVPRDDAAPHLRHTVHIAHVGPVRRGQL